MGGVMREGNSGAALGGEICHEECSVEDVGGRRLFGGGGDEEGAEIVAAEGEAGDSADRESDATLLAAVGGIADDAVTAPVRGPEMVFGVDGEAVRETVLFVRGDPRGGVGESAVGEGVIEAGDGAAEGVGVEEMAAVAGEGKAVGAEDAGEDGGQGAVVVEAIEAAGVGVRGRREARRGTWCRRRRGRRGRR